MGKMRTLGVVRIAPSVIGRCREYCVWTRRLKMGALCSSRICDEVLSMSERRAIPLLVSAQAPFSRTALVLCVGLFVTVASISRIATAKEQKLNWFTLPAGLKELREKKRPAIVWYTGNATRNAPHFFNDFVQSRRFQRLANKFVLIRVVAGDLSKPYPGARAGKPQRAGDKPVVPTVALYLRLLEDPTAFLVLDFREHIVRRYEPQKNRPKSSKIAADLSWIVAIGKKKQQDARPTERSSTQAAHAQAAKAAVFPSTITR